MRKPAKKVPAKSKGPFTDHELIRIQSAIRYSWEEIHSDFMSMVNDPDHDSGKFTVRDVVETAMETLAFSGALDKDLDDKVSCNYSWVVRFLVRNKSSWY